MNRNSQEAFGLISVASLKQLIPWGDHFKLGQPQLDAQHEAIFNITMEIAESWQSRGDIDRLHDLTEKLAIVLEVHFRFEERMLAEVGYTKLDEHRAEHKVILEELRVIRARLERLPPGADRIAPAFIVHNFVLGLTVGHLTHSDMDYCELARKHGPTAGDMSDVAALASAKPAPLEEPRSIAVVSVARAEEARPEAKTPAARELPVSSE